MASSRADWVFGRGAVDFVGEHDVGEERAGLEDELAAAVDFLEHRVAGDVAGQQVGGELDALGAEVEEFREALDEFGLAEAGQAFEQDVAAGENAGDDEIDQFLLAEEDLVEAAGERAEVFGGSADFGFGGVFHGRTVANLERMLAGESSGEMMKR